MFFSISSTSDSRFPNSYPINIGFFNCDSGWTQTIVNRKIIFYKGYSSVDICELVANTTPQYLGNFCCVIVGEETTVTHDVNRGFPLYWYPNNMLTNLSLESESKYVNLYSDRYVSIDSNFGLTEHFFDCYGPIDSTTITFDQCVDQLAELLIEQVKDLQLPNQYQLFLSGGIDTCLLLALLNSQKIDYNLLDYEHFDYDTFTYKNINFIKKKHWAYAQMHHWRTPNTLITGGCGDEFFFRGPTAIALWAAWHNIDVVTLLKQYPTSYHAKYFLKNINQETFQQALANRNQILKDYPTEADLVKQLLNINVNDHQHWHLGETLTVTPYKNLEITKLLLRLSKEDLLKQVLNAEVSKALIWRLDPTALKYVSPYKNYNNLAIFND
jgi:hypothetical protein